MASTSVFEHSYYIGNYMSGILYGIELVLYSMTIRLLLNKSSPSSSDKFFMAYSTILVLLLTIDISCNAVWGEQMWITYRDRPGGVAAYIAKYVSASYETLGSTSVVAMIFMGDGLLLYRCFIIWGSSYLIMIVPTLIYSGAFALAIIELVAAGVPGGDFFAGRSVNFGTPYYAMTISLNVIVTLLICFRLVSLSKAIRSTLDPESAKLYTSIATMMIESAAPYSIVGIMFLIPYARGSPTAISFGQVWAKFTCISPQLIILRVTSGKAWRKDTIVQQHEEMVFATPAPTSNTMSVPVALSKSPNESSHGSTTLGGDSGKGRSASFFGGGIDSMEEV